MRITHYSETDKEYIREVRSCKTLSELRAITERYKTVAEDAHATAMTMTEQDFAEFCKSRSEFKPSLIWMNKYGEVLLPKVIIEVGLIACKFHMPFGAAYLRMKELGKLE